MWYHRHRHRLRYRSYCVYMLQRPSELKYIFIDMCLLLWTFFSFLITLRLCLHREIGKKVFVYALAKKNHFKCFENKKIACTQEKKCQRRKFERFETLLHCKMCNKLLILSNWVNVCAVCTNSAQSRPCFKLYQ